MKLVKRLRRMVMRRFFRGDDAPVKTRLRRGSIAQLGKASKPA
jgi:hypothetical protein